MDAAGAPLSDAAVALRGLRFGWPGADRPCLDMAGFTLSAGERLFLHGPSGSGKTTLLSLIGGVLRADAGALRVLGHDLAALSGPRRDRFRAGTPGGGCAGGARLQGESGVGIRGGVWRGGAANTLTPLAGV